MKTLLFALAATSALAISAPATAQYGAQANVYSGQNAYAGQPGMDNRIAQLDSQLQAGLQNGAITNAEARPIRMQIRQLARLERQYAADGVSQRERQDLQSRIRYIRDQLRAADGRGNGRYGTSADGNYGNGYANNYGNGYGYNNGYANQVSYREVNQVCASRSGGGIGGILGSIFGSDNCLRVGERLNGQLSALPGGYANQFRDGNGYYYGYLNGNVVQVQSNTSIVTRIYAVG